MNPAISPETRLGELLHAYPGVEDSLIEWVPALARLKNPVLRETFTRTATLDQAARLGGISARDLVTKIRELTGQPEAADSPIPAAVTVVERIDADAMLATGVHPVGRVRQACAHLSPGEAIEMSVGFRPAPLIDTMQRSGYAVTCEPSPAGGFLVLFAKP